MPKPPAPKKSHYKINLLFFARFFEILRLSNGYLSFILSSFILLISILQQILVYYVGLLASKFTKTLVDQDFPAFKQVLCQALALMSAISVVNAVVQYASSMLYVHWRQNMCKHLHKLYFSGFNYFHINSTLSSEKFIDNVDQRLAADLDKMLLTFANMFPLLLLSPFTIAYYACKCYLTTGVFGPLVIFGVFCVGTVVNKFLMGPVVTRTVAQELAEGNFRFLHMRVRSSCQSIAFYRGEKYESINADERLDKLISVQTRLFFSQFVVKTFTSFYDYMGAIQSYLVIAIPIFGGQFDHKSPGERSELVSAYAFQSLYLIYCFSQLIDLSNKVSELAGVTHRVGELLETLQIMQGSVEMIAENRMKRESQNSDQGSQTLEALQCSSSDSGLHDDNSKSDNSGHGEYLLKVESVSFGLPGGEKFSSMVENAESTDDDVLIKFLDFNLSSGDKLLISGPNGVGKSSLFRILNSMWEVQSGNVSFQLNKTKMFLPQTPYFCQGSLIRQLFYPKIVEINDSTIDRVVEVLKTLNLEYIIERCGSITEDHDWDWSSVFSQGEAQRLSFGRVMLSRPNILFMDESTSAVSNDEQARIYKILSCQSEIECFVTIAHSPSLTQYHNCVLTISPDKTWKFEQLRK
ncbi:lysosomal cobalamin transporter ABCD4-like [Symsagittifera roscoffensis]|uniref:lysosomal cobalamin transporter ABCD4-like n=1 Tax=Symsagittifera roscoffensis TaxID=84072 RepID=UPI00307B78EA